LRLWVAGVFFVLAGAAALIGDHSHVVTGTTEYLSHPVPFVWSSPFWFPVLVGAATVSLAELRLHLPAPRSGMTLRWVTVTARCAASWSRSAARSSRR